MSGAPSPDRAAGFTLVELLVALLVFAMLAAAGVALLRVSVDSQALAKARLDTIAGERRIDALLTADLAQAVGRMVRNEAGDPLPAFEGDADRFAFVRAGWDNLDDAPRAELQRVEYRIENGRLLRRHWPMLDGAAAEPPSVLAERVVGARLRYRSREDWRERWDPLRADLLPRAVELTLQRADGPEYRYLFLVGAGA
jgi:general secretion pathway protein J